MRSSQDLLLKWNFSLGDWLEGCNILISIRWQSFTKVVELISSDLFPVSVFVSKLRFFCLLKVCCDRRSLLVIIAGRNSLQFALSPRGVFEEDLDSDVFLYIFLIRGRVMACWCCCWCWQLIVIRGISCKLTSLESAH